MSFSGAERQREPIKFDEVRRRWAIVEDGAFAQALQDDEVTQHFDYNRKTRHTVRADLQVARGEQEREQLRVQAERLRRVEEHRRREEEFEGPALTAVQPLEPHAAIGGPSSAGEPDTDRLAQLELERKDELMARSLQEREERRYERWKKHHKEKELQRERRQLERSIAADLEAAERAEDNGDFSDFYRVPESATDTTRRRMQTEQDADIARLLQEQELKRRGASEERKHFEEKDRRLAEVIQQLEELRAARKRKQRRHRDRTPSAEAATQTTGEQRESQLESQHESQRESQREFEREPSPIYDNVASTVCAPLPLLEIPSPNAYDGHGTLYFDSGSPLVDKGFVGSPVTRLDNKIRAGDRLVRRPPGARESLIEAVTGSAELGMQLAQRGGSHPPAPMPVNSSTNSSGNSNSQQSRPQKLAPPDLPARPKQPPIQRVIAVDPPTGHRAQVLQPGPFAFENSTLFRPAIPFSNPETATTPLGPTTNIATAIDPTYRPEVMRRTRAQSAGPVPTRPLSMHEPSAVRAHRAATEWEEGVPVPIHGERRRPSDPRLGVSADNKKNSNCKMQ